MRTGILESEGVSGSMRGVMMRPRVLDVVRRDDGEGPDDDEGSTVHTTWGMSR